MLHSDAHEDERNVMRVCMNVATAKKQLEAYICF
jgi:hypothetical protein